MLGRNERGQLELFITGSLRGLIHPSKQGESQNHTRVDPEGSERSAGATPMLPHGYRADLIEAGLNEPAGRFGAMGIVALALAWRDHRKGERADEWCRTVG